MKAIVYTKYGSPDQVPCTQRALPAGKSPAFTQDAGAMVVEEKRQASSLLDNKVSQRIR